jgi:RimJ/RimL family protein N-acetyltransferase
MRTARLELVPHAPADLLALMEGTAQYEARSGQRAAAGLRDFFTSGEQSPAWHAQLRAATAADPWTYGFALIHLVDGVVVGTAGFKGPPTDERIVEIAYGVVPAYQGQGLATEAAVALVQYAFADRRVDTVRAHTLPEANASTRVLTKCGFHYQGPVVEPEDGPVWRWEKRRPGD